MSHIDNTQPVDGGTVIPNPDTRRHIGAGLYVLTLLAGLAALFLGIFPEVGGDLANRVLMFVNATVAFLSAAFGIAVTLPNVPRR